MPPHSFKLSLVTLADISKQIFDKPVFLEEGATASDVRQGKNRDCWFMSALCALGGKKDLIDRVCVARDEKVGVYGFVFHRGTSSDKFLP